MSGPFDAADRPGALARLASGYWETVLEARPLFASTLGDARYDDRLPDHAPAGVAATRARFEDLGRRVEELAGATAGGGRARFSGEDEVTLSALREAVASDVAHLGTGLLAWNVDPLDGLPTDVLDLPDYQRLETPADGERMVARWRAMAPYVDQHVANLRRSLGEGRVACLAPVERTVDILEELLAADTPAWPLLAPLARLDGLAGWTSAERDRFAGDLRAAVEREVRPAFARLRDTLATEIRPVARPVDRPGVCHVDGGEAAYRHLVRVHTSLELDPETLHETGLREIERIDAELAELGGRVLGAPSLQAVLAALRGDPALHFATREEVFATADRSLARAAGAIPAWFGRLPEVPCEVVRMGAHEEVHSTIAYYRQPAADGSRPGQYYVNTYAPATRPRYEAEVLAYHESIPGHHLQVAIAQELRHLPAFRRHLGPTAFVEGWGLYTERLSDEMGLYSADLDRIGVLSFDAWRASRLVVDTGMHALGWPRERAVRFMLEHTALGSNNIENEVDRYIVLPGQALAYKTGQLEMLRLRAEAEARLGSAFDVRAFHDVLLGSGALPLPTLERVMEAWIAERAARG